MATEIDVQVGLAINDIRRMVYGTGISLILLKENGVQRKYDEGPELTDNFMVAPDKTGNMTIFIKTNAYDDFLAVCTHVAFQEKVFELTEPARPKEGPIDIRKLTARPMGHRYVYEA